MKALAADYAKGKLRTGSSIARVLHEVVQRWNDPVVTLLPHSISIPENVTLEAFEMGGCGSLVVSQRELADLVQHSVVARNNVFIIENGLNKESDREVQKYASIMQVLRGIVYYVIEARCVHRAPEVIRHATIAYHFLGYFAPWCAHCSLVDYARNASMIVVGAFDEEGYIIISRERLSGAIGRVFGSDAENRVPSKNQESEPDAVDETDAEKTRD